MLSTAVIPILRDFYPRSPCGERRYSLRHSAQGWHFYPRSPCGERPHTAKNTSIAGHFYPRSPCGERLGSHYSRWPFEGFLSTLSLRRATRLGLPGWLRVLISIHALLAESDVRGEHHANSQQEFLSTLSLRRATMYHRVDRAKAYISIHALLAESDDTWARGSRVTYVISIHALLAESDNLHPGYCALIHSFLSTLSLRRATLNLPSSPMLRNISIHALLAESDLRVLDGSKSSIISIHALLAESDDRPRG